MLTTYILVNVLTSKMVAYCTSPQNADNPNGYPFIIGNDVTVGHKVMLHGCTIGDRVLVGMGAIVLMAL